MTAFPLHKVYVLNIIIPSITCNILVAKTLLLSLASSDASKINPLISLHFYKKTISILLEFEADFNVIATTFLIESMMVLC